MSFVLSIALAAGAPLVIAINGETALSPGELLARADLREIALGSGFSSHAHMSAAFRQRLGVAPRDLLA